MRDFAQPATAFPGVPFIGRAAGRQVSMYIQLVVAVPVYPPDAEPRKRRSGPDGPGVEPPKGSVDLTGNVQAASEIEKAITKRGWHYDVVILGTDTPPGKSKTPDLVVNCICDPTLHERSLTIVAGIVSRYRVPVFNHPWAVMKSGRAASSYVLEHQAGVNMPLTSLYDTESGPLAGHLERRGHTLPVLGRPIGAHGGRDLLRIDSADTIPPPLDGLRRFFVTDFVDYVSKDGLYRKYRMIYVGDRLFRRHLVISDSWKVAGESREVMYERPGLIDEEKAFIAGRDGGFEDRIIHQFRALGLDFGVVDFNIAGDGGITIFEINPCFQITAAISAEKREKWAHLDLEELWGYLEETNETIVEAVLDAMEERVRGAGRRP